MKTISNVLISVRLWLYYPDIFGLVMCFYPKILREKMESREMCGGKESTASVIM